MTSNCKNRKSRKLKPNKVNHSWKVRSNDLVEKLHEKETEMNKNKKNMETKINNLERFVRGWFGDFDPLVRRPSLEHKCEECDYVGRNSARLKTQVELKHLHICTECAKKYRVGETSFKTKEELNDHNKIVHENLDHILTEEEFDNLSKVNLFCLRKGQRDTPKSIDAEKKKNLRERRLRFKQKKLNI